MEMHRLVSGLLEDDAVPAETSVGLLARIAVEAISALAPRAGADVSRYLESFETNYFLGGT